MVATKAKASDKKVVRELKRLRISLGKEVREKHRCRCCRCCRCWW